MCAKLRTVAASNNTYHPTRSLSSSPLASTVSCSPGSQALLEVTHQYHSIGITLLLLVRATYCACIFVLRAHPVRGESYNQRNTTGEVATLAFSLNLHSGSKLCSRLDSSKCICTVGFCFRLKSPTLARYLVWFLCLRDDYCKKQFEFGRFKK